MYQRYPFLQHFLDESGEDSWIIPMLARRYLTGRGSYHKKGGETKKKNSKKDENPGEEEEEELGGPEASANNPDEYDDDYTENGIVHPTSSNPRPTHSQSGPPVVAREEARAKTHETQTAKDTSQALKNARAIASTLSKGKGKQRASPTRDPTPATDSDEEVVRRTTTKVKPGARKHARIVSPEPEDQTTTTHKEKNTSSSSKKRKVAEVEPDHEEVEVEVEGPAGKQKKPKPSSTTTANKRKVIEPEAEIEDQETQEPPTKKTKARPKMRPQPPPEPTSTHPPSTVDISSDTAASQPAGVLDLASSSSQVAGSSRKPIPVGSSDPAEAVTGATTKASRAKGPRAVGTIKISVPPSRRSGRLNANSE
ncbi:Retrotransposable element Tf2 protein [Ceratobasidium sp. AG-Ba]|nr:Retrotransposable element Tf2 protein [Ceratobasidium sp. AG-Ba]